MKARRVFETVLYARDLVAMEQFYRDMFGLEVIGRGASRVRVLSLRFLSATTPSTSPRRLRSRARRLHVAESRPACLHGPSTTALAAAADVESDRRATHRVTRHAGDRESMQEGRPVGDRAWRRTPRGRCTHARRLRPSGARGACNCARRPRAVRRERPRRPQPAPRLAGQRPTTDAARRRPG